MIGIQPGGRFTAVNVPSWDLIRQAYSLQRTQLVGGPDWLETARFDIVAKAEGDIPRAGPGAPPGPLNFMLQDLLEDRFKLEAHRETREMPIYSLIPGAQRTKAGSGASRIDHRLRSHARARPRGRWAGVARRPGAAPAPGERPTCGMMSGPGTDCAGRMPMPQLAQMLSQFTQRIVVDRTGLAGNYDIDLTFTPDRMPQGPPPPGVQLPNIDPNGPSVFTAVQEQLGLKLESERGSGRSSRHRSCRTSDAGLGRPIRSQTGDRDCSRSLLSLSPRATRRLRPTARPGHLQRPSGSRARPSRPFRATQTIVVSSDVDGRYDCRPGRRGSYTLRVEMLGFATITREVLLGDDERSDVRARRSCRSRK